MPLLFRKIIVHFFSNPAFASIIPRRLLSFVANAEKRNVVVTRNLGAASICVSRSLLLTTMPKTAEENESATSDGTQLTPADLAERVPHRVDITEDDLKSMVEECTFTPIDP